jgi:hypothetical protein
LFTEESSFTYARGNVPDNSPSTEQTDRGAQHLGTKSYLSMKIETQILSCKGWGIVWLCTSQNSNLKVENDMYSKHDNMNETPVNCMDVEFKK